MHQGVTARLPGARLRHDQRGVAFMEFALTMPVLMALILGGIELTHLVLAHQQVSRVAALAADNAARYRPTIDEADVRKLMLGSRLAAAGIDMMGKGRLIISSVTQNPKKDGYWIRWQRCEGQLTISSAFGAQGLGKSDTSLQSVDGMLIAPGTNVMFAEAVYDYEPLFVGRWSGTTRIRYQASAMARQLTTYDITNLNKETAMTC